VTTAPDRQSAPEDGPGPALFAVRMRLGLVLSLFLLAGVGWWWTTDQMRGMDSSEFRLF